jgi:mercuric ion transport protein
MRNRIFRYLYLVAAWLFGLGILGQVYLVGLSLLGDRPSWQNHIDLGHTIGGFALLMLIFAYVGRLPRTMKRLTWLNFGIYFLIADVIIFMTDSAPKVAALHPVLVILLFPVAATLAVRITMIVLVSPAETVAVSNEPVLSSTQ